VEEKAFDLVLTGHIHKSFGRDSIGGTEVVNPGAVADGRYGILETGDEIDVKFKELG